MANKKGGNKNNNRNNNNRNNKNNRNNAPKQKEEPRQVINLEFDDETEKECFVEGIFDVDGEDYIALAPDDNSGDIYIYKYNQINDEEYDLEDEEDDEKFAAAVRTFEDLMGHKEEA